VDTAALNGARSQREAWAAALSAGLRVVDVSRNDGQLAAELSPERDAIVCLDRLDGALADALHVPADAGVRVLLSLSDIEPERALALFERVGQGSLVYQYVAEGSLLADGAVADAEEAAAALEFADRADPDDAAAFLYAINVPERVASAALELPRVRAHAAPVHVRRLRELELANAELWTTNRELGRQLRELRVQLHGGVPPMSAARIGATTAGSALARIAREQDAAREAADERERELRLRIEQLEWDLRERVRALDAEVQRVGGERDDNARERDLATRELERLRELTQRRAVRLALRLADLRHGVIRR
jgi:hypothetical protein